MAPSDHRLYEGPQRCCHSRDVHRHDLAGDRPRTLERAHARTSPGYQRVGQNEVHPTALLLERGKAPVACVYILEIDGNHMAATAALS